MENFEKMPFFRADTTGVGKYGTPGYGWMGVYNVKDPKELHTAFFVLTFCSTVCPS